MIDFSEFSTRCKMRYDFADQIQVRYHHTNGEKYDTWVSGEEVAQRLASEAAERRLKGLSRLRWSQLKETADDLPAKGKQRAQNATLDWLADNVDETVGGNVIGETLADAIRSRDSNLDPDLAKKQRWTTLLQDAAFRAKILELAWIQLEGSFPDDQSPEDPDDWI